MKKMACAAFLSLELLISAGCSSLQPPNPTAAASTTALPVPSSPVPISAAPTARQTSTVASPASPPASSPTVTPEAFASGNTAGNTVNVGTPIAMLGDLAVCATPDGIVKCNADGSGKAVLCTLRAEDLNVLGDHVYFKNPDGIWRVGQDGKGIVQLRKGYVAYFNATSDGLYFIAYNLKGKNAYDCQVEKTDVDGGNETVFDTAGKGVFYDLSVDGGFLYYTLNLDKKVTLIRSGIDGKGRTTLLTAGTGGIFRPQPAGGAVYFINMNDKKMPTGILRLDPVAKKLTCVLAGGPYACLNVSGQALFFSKYKNKWLNSGVYRVGLDGKDAVRIADADIYSIYVFGSRLFFTGGTNPDDPSSSRLYCMPADGGKPVFLTDATQGK